MKSPPVLRRQLIFLLLLALVVFVSGCTTEYEKGYEMGAQQVQSCRKEAAAGVVTSSTRLKIGPTRGLSESEEHWAGRQAGWDDELKKGK